VDFSATSSDESNAKFWCAVEFLAGSLLDHENGLSLGLYSNFDFFLLLENNWVNHKTTCICNAILNFFDNFGEYDKEYAA
jgi:hypothetical protein